MASSAWMLAVCVAALTVTVVGAAANKQAERNCSLTPPYLPSTAVNTSLQLQQLRVQMQSSNISAYIIPGTDAHMSEYIALRDARLAFMTGFTGSAGTAVVTQSKAVLWTDSRYWVQAERQMDCNWELEKDASISSVADWLMSELPLGSSVSFDPFLFSLETFQNYASDLESSGLRLNPITTNLVDTVWKDRPPLSAESLIRLPDRVINRSWQMKVQEIRNLMMENLNSPTALLLSALDETAWLFNLRGNDIPYNPFFYSYTLLTQNEIWLFVHTERVTKDLEEYLEAHCSDPLCVQLKPYDSVLQELSKYVLQPDIRVWIGTEYTNYALFQLIPQAKLITSTYSPVLTSKAVKDETEEQVLRDAHVRDAVAVIQLLMWLENVVPQGNETELSAAEYVNKCRSKQKDNRGPSFETISASGPNAALAHYSASVETNRRLTVDEMYLVDSGGQYLDGTTDITRTVHWGTPTQMQKEAFTRVLMGNIEISRTVFPSGTRGVNLEMLGRRALWEVGLNYGHGTGHGVGNYFGVHEWPVGFQTNNIPFRAGMFTSIGEPGYYKENDFGIRIEDIAVTVPAQTKYGNNYLTFDTVSLVPYDRKLIDISLLSTEQRKWLNKYYETIRRLVGPELDKQGLHEENNWMLKNTEAFPELGSSASICSSSLTLIALAATLLHSVS
ncbi:xaa-Pro aminopeptidase 2 isoform X1 [Oryzias melastigma]|uniref:xaa-Pro aminopeptidase 2 isoform X1 n=1 Tax=Oryzias melastigma TaxID=30732 RepID=UPI000CF7D8B4|nr:xaa-Pro aminopeptidase 2 isoform X1 [Oryzias melastigma]